MRGGRKPGRRSGGPAWARWMLATGTLKLDDYDTAIGPQLTRAAFGGAARPRGGRPHRQRAVALVEARVSHWWRGLHAGPVLPRRNPRHGGAHVDGQPLRHLVGRPFRRTRNRRATRPHPALDRRRAQGLRQEPMVRVAADLRRGAIAADYDPRSSSASIVVSLGASNWPRCSILKQRAPRGPLPSHCIVAHAQRLPCAPPPVPVLPPVP